MFQDADVHIGRIVGALKQKQMYDNTLVIYSADNGGVTDGNNYPLRGEKHTSFEGGMRVTAFVSGGKNVIPESKRGTTDNSIYHIVDWYPTICHLAGVDDCSDNAPTAPLKPDLSHPSRDLYQGNASYPSLDGLNIWDSLMAAKNETDDREIVLSAEVIISGRYKLVVAQPDPKLMSSKSLNLGWKGKDGAWEQPAGPANGGCLKYMDRTDFQPCLFDVVADPSERHDLASAHPDIVNQLWSRLNLTLLTAYTSGNGNGSPAHLLGKCHTALHTKQKWGKGFEAPSCGWLHRMDAEAK